MVGRREGGAEGCKERGKEQACTTQGESGRPCARVGEAFQDWRRMARRGSDHLDGTVEQAAGSSAQKGQGHDDAGHWAAEHEHPAKAEVEAKLWPLNTQRHILQPHTLDYLAVVGHGHDAWLAAAIGRGNGEAQRDGDGSIAGEEQAVELPGFAQRVGATEGASEARQRKVGRCHHAATLPKME